jgi:DNA polymerase III subunit delta
MITTYTGENRFTLSQALRETVTSFETEHGSLTIERIDGEDVDFGSIQRALTSLPMLATKQLVVLSSPSKNKQFLDQFEQLLTAVPDTTDVIIVEPKLDRRLNYYKYLKLQTTFKEFPELDAQTLSHWLVALVKERQGSLTLQDARYLVERIGNNQQLLSQEINKLLLYGSTVDRHTITLLTEPVPQSTIFELLEASFAGQSKKALELYEEQRTQKVEPQQIVALLGWQLHVLAIIKTAGERSVDQIAREAKINPYVVRKSQAIARRLNISELKKLISDLMSIDSRMKRSSLNADEALQHYLLNISLQ